MFSETHSFLFAHFQLARVSGPTQPLPAFRIRGPGGRTARSLTPSAAKPNSPVVPPRPAAPRGCGVGEGRKRESRDPPAPGAHPLPAPLPLHCASGPQAAAIRGAPQAPSAAHPRAAPAGADTQSPGSQPLRRQSAGRGGKRGLTYGAAAAALPQPGTPTVGRTAASLVHVLPSSAFGGGNIFFLHLPPSPPPHLLLLLPLLLRTTEVPRVRHRDSQQHGCRRCLPSPPPAHRARAMHSGRRGRVGGALTEVRLLSAASVASPALPAPAGGSSARAHALCARASRSCLRRALPRPRLAGSPLGLGLAAARDANARRTWAAQAWSPECWVRLSSRVGPRLPN